MVNRWETRRRHVGRILLSLTAVWIVATAVPADAQTPSVQVTFTKDVAPILQKACQQCHRPDSVAPMSLITYEQVRPHARSFKQRTHLGQFTGMAGVETSMVCE